MPITKVPVVHKFGIISHSQRLQLQQRLLKLSLDKTLGTHRPATVTRNPLEVTEDFVFRYNAAEKLDEKEKLEDTAFKMLHRIKRRTGLKDGSKGAQVDLPVAWTELSQLAQCKGKIQEDCFDVLISSLDQAPLRTVHIPALFFLAETTLYWLRTDAALQPYLRTGELKLLRMGQLVFFRLFYHHMAGHLQGHVEFKNRLFTYLDGFHECQEVYNPYPNALLSVRYMNEVGKMVIGDCNTEAGEVKEGDIISSKATQSAGKQPHTHYEDAPLSQSGGLSWSVHELSPTLWHSLDVWRCVRQLAGGLNVALQALGNCGMSMASESWPDGVCALLVLADAAKADIKALRTLQNLARGVAPPGPNHPTHSYTATHDLLHTEAGTGTFAYSPGDTPVDGRITTHSVPDEVPQQKRTPHHRTPISSPQKQPSGNTKPGDNGALHRHKTHESGLVSAPDTALRAEVGSVEGRASVDGRASQTSSVPTFTNEAHAELTGIHSWHWEVAITYADILSDICLHGATSTIQKTALLGHRKDVHHIERLASQPACPMVSAGLLDLVFFHAIKEQQDGGPDDWSWRVRYSALQGLVKLCRCCEAQSTKEGLRTVAWSVLVRVHSLEADPRVLEALKVGQVDASIEDLMTQHEDMTANAVGGKIAAGMAKLYLPALPPPVEDPTRRKPHKAPVTRPAMPTTRPPLRTSLRQELMLATAFDEPVPSYNQRADFDLHRIIEDQWRKQLHDEQDEEEDVRMGKMKEAQEGEEQQQQQREVNRQHKLGTNCRTAPCAVEAK